MISRIESHPITRARRWPAFFFWPRGNAYGTLTVPGSVADARPGDEFVMRYGDAVMLADDGTVIPSTYRRAHRERYEIVTVEIDRQAGEVAFTMRPIVGLYRPVYALKKIAKRALNVLR